MVMQKVRSLHVARFNNLTIFGWMKLRLNFKLKWKLVHRGSGKKVQFQVTVLSLNIGIITDYSKILTVCIGTDRAEQPVQT